MKFDTPLIVMLGVVGLGAFAVYRMTKTDGAKPQTTQPGLLGPTIRLEQGARYQGRLALKPIDAPPLGASRDQLAQFLQVLGFRDVAVHMTPGELPFNWPDIKTGDSTNRWFEGTWNNPTTNLPRPKQVDRLTTGGNTLISGMTG